MPLLSWYRIENFPNTNPMHVPVSSMSSVCRSHLNIPSVPPLLQSPDCVIPTKAFMEHIQHIIFYPSEGLIVEATLPASLPDRLSDSVPSSSTLAARRAPFAALADGI